MTGADATLHRVRRRLRVLSAGALLLAVLSACTAPPPDPLFTGSELPGARFVVGGGPTDELQLLCQVTVAAVEAAGARASDQCARFGAAEVSQPPERSFVDTGWAYPARSDRDPDRRADPRVPPAAPQDIARADAARGVTRLAPAPFSDGDVVVAPGPAPHGVGTVSTLAAGTLCAPPGAAAVLTPYRRPMEVVELDPAQVLVGVARGECDAGLVPSSSGRIPALGLVPLVDDLGVLARPGPAPILRSEVVAAHPGVVEVLGRITPLLTDETVRALNREVTQDGRDARDVARDWMRARGLI